MIEGMQLRHYNAELAAGLVNELVAVYLDAHAGDGEFYSEDRYRRQLGGHMLVTGWVLVTATVDRELAGYAYGFPLSSQTRWWEGIQEPVPGGFTAEDGKRTFALSELLVRPSWRRRGIARALHDELIGSRSEERATLLTRPDNFAAQAAYSSWRWQKVTMLRPAWENAPSFDVFIRQILRR